MKHLKNRWVEKLRRIKFWLWLHEDIVLIALIFMFVLTLAGLGVLS